MALPTHGRVLLDTTVGDIDIELWSRVRDVTRRRTIRSCQHKVCLSTGSTESMPEFHRVGHGRYAPAFAGTLNVAPDRSLVCPK
jgi:peptidyl-prolyl cis-trans isomerase SDCCAG10